MNRWNPIENREESATAPLEDVAFLARSTNRVVLLDALRWASFERHELREQTSMSTPTLARILREFEERGWVERDGCRYRATTVGALVADGLLGAIETIETVHRLTPLLRTVPIDGMSVDPATLSGAQVTIAEPGAPLAPVRRFVALTEQSGTLREVNATSVQHFDPDVLGDRVADGRRTDLIYERRVVESLRSDHAETFDALLECGATTLSVHESVPFGLSIFDERVGLCGYDRKRGGLTVFVDTDDSETRRWAEALYECYREDAVSVADSDGREEPSNEPPARPASVPAGPFP